MDIRETREDKMKDIEVIKYLITEIEEEQEYNREYKEARQQAMLESGRDGSHRYWDYMPKHLDRSPRQSIIKRNAIKIRQLLLKIY